MGTISRIASATFVVSAGITALSIAASVRGQTAPPPLAVAPPPSAQTLWLDQGWSGAQRQTFHYQSQGTQTLPIPTSWFLALEVPHDDAGPDFSMFRDPAYLERFGFIPGAAGSDNPDTLPIGFARTVGIDPRNSKPFDAIGFTCAACHTARVDYQNTTLLIDGGPAMIDLGSFGAKLALALGETELSDKRFKRFAIAVLGPDSSWWQRAKLRVDVAGVLKAGLGDVLQNFKLHGITEGAGRLDALNRIGNTVFGSGMKIPANQVAITAPVAYPHLWDTSWFSWVQYNGSIEQPMVRNAGEAMGVSAIINFNAGPTPRFTSTVPVGKLHDPIERALAGDTQPQPAGRFSGLHAPAWPEAVLGTIDPALASRGAGLYQAKCQGCHLPAPNTPEFWASAAWTPPNAAGERYLDLAMVPIATIGTDEAQAADMAKRIVKASPALGLPNPVSTQGPLYSYSFGPALGATVALVVNRWYDAQFPPTPPATRAQMDGNRPNGIRAPLAYKARPLDGIWATAPYLHNGAVPTLWALLSPYAERPARFNLGVTGFDPVHVGYVDGGTTKIDTRLRGNRNGGHLFDSSSPALPGTIGATLAPEDRRALVEYLKTL